MHTDLLVSICVVTYNSRLYIEETLDSVKKQTYSNLELIISDDNSTDDTVPFCEQWLKKNKACFKRVELIKSKQNTGIAPNCNRAYFAACGEWIKGVAGDDVLFPDCIEKNVRFIKNHPEAQLIQSYNLYIDSNSYLLNRDRYEKDIFFFNACAEKQHEILLRKYVANTVSTFMKRSLFIEVGGFDEQIKMMEDYPFWLLCTGCGIKIHFMDELTMYYRIHQASISNGGEKNRLKILPPIFEYNFQVREKYILPYLMGVERYVAKWTVNWLRYFIDSRFNHKTWYNLFVYRVLIAPGLLMNKFTLHKLYKQSR